MSKWRITYLQWWLSFKSRANNWTCQGRYQGQFHTFCYVKIQMENPERVVASLTQVIGFTNWISYSQYLKERTVQLWVNASYLFSWWCNYWLDWSFYMLPVSFWRIGTGEQNAIAATCPKRWLFGSKSLVICSFRKVMMLLEVTSVFSDMKKCVHFRT